MRLPFFIARRYLFAKKSSNAINVITLVAMTGIAVGTAALIVVLSVFNGISGLIGSLFAAIDPDIKVMPAKGKTFVEDSASYARIRARAEVAYVARTFEGKAGLQYRDRQTFATLKGVEADFTQVATIDSTAYLYEGSFDLSPTADSIAQGVFGSVVAGSLAADRTDDAHPISVFVPGDDVSLLNPTSAVRRSELFIAGYFSTQKEYDSKYVFVDFDYARTLFGKENELTAYEVRLKNPSKAGAVARSLAKDLGPDFKVLTRHEQHATLYRVMQNEKYVSYLILVLMLVIASVNIIGSLSMIVIEKTRDIAVLKAAGAPASLIRRIFLTEGLLVGGIGTGAGLLFATGFVLLQQQYGFLRLSGGDSFIVDAFPMEMHLADLLLIGGTVLSLAIVAAIYPARKAAEITVVEGLRK